MPSLAHTEMGHTKYHGSSMFAFRCIIWTLLHVFSGTKNRSRANCVPIYGDLHQNLQWSLTFKFKGGHLSQIRV